MSDTPVIVWFRQDLRLTDNPALAEAAASGRPVIPVYVLDETGDALGGASLWWLDKSLAALDAGLGERGSRLILRRGDPALRISEIIAATGAGAVYWNRLYDRHAVARDSALKSDLKAAGIEVVSCNGGLLAEPWTVKTGGGEPYKVFTPYWRAARAKIEPVPARPAPPTLPAPATWPHGDRLADWGLHPRNPDWSGGFSIWTPGEDGANTALERFLQRGMADYAQARDRPDVEGTSRLSPHLHFGEIGPRQVWHAVQLAMQSGKASIAKHGEKYLSELGWREFSHHLLYHFPALPQQNFRADFDDFPWDHDEAALKRWQRGQTGYPIVDAGMRELWHTGWMHNRVRMVVASFLVKHLRQHWHQGEAWFWDTLVDADLANNAASWQWVAGSGADAAPYFRIFNPILQGERFDPEGDYVRRWVPELQALPARFIHKPWEAPALVLREAGVTLGATYPMPMVEHDKARALALAAFSALRGQAGAEAEATMPRARRSRGAA